MKTKITLVILIGLLLLSSCQTQKKSDKLDITQAFIGGNVGLNVFLLEGLPPPVVYDKATYPFGVGVTIENVGEADVGPGTPNPFVRVRLEGINPTEFGTTDAQVVQDLAVPLRSAKRNFDGTILPGEVTTAVFQPLNYLPDLRGNQEFTIRADTCYDYTNLATAKVCIKDEVLENIQDDSICSLVGEKNPQNSGGPVHITSLVENPLADNKIQISFVVEHIGKGEFFGRDPNEICDFSVRNFNKFFVDVVIRPLAAPDLLVTCTRFGGTNQGRLKLFQGAPATIQCVIERIGPSKRRIYQEVMEIELRYRYGQFIETPVLVQDVTN